MDSEYDPALGRFTSVAPRLDLGDPQSWTGYAYANDNPVDLADRWPRSAR
ncbi:hypothetical protein [Actinokineospora sp. NBRC 105648]|nr:hypothetical protein [Actinokineospora sp. NBRC 105648]GLZ39913.1 hypothetical protein Acsp05_35370 [Actinokineospora sp. NBRC 105648]